MDRSRLLVALLLGGPEATEIDGIRRGLGDRAIGRIPPHITLVPPVNVNARRIDTAFEVVRSAATKTGALRLHIGPAATFLPRNPVVYLSVGGDTADLGALRDRLWVDPLARAVDHPFVPHVTVAGRMDEALIPPVVEALAWFEADVSAERVHVLRQGDPIGEGRGPRWEPIGDAPLGGPHVVGRGGVEIVLTAGDTLDAEARAFFDRAWSSHVDASFGTVPPTRAWVVTARVGDRVVGVALGAVDDELRVDRLVVDGAARGLGVGSRLLTEAELVGARHGCRHGQLLCQATGPVDWYRARGWRDDGVLPAWRHGRDFVRLRRALPS